MEQEAAFAPRVSVARGGSRQPHWTWLRFRLLWRRMKAPSLASLSAREQRPRSTHIRGGRRGERQREDEASRPRRRLELQKRWVGNQTRCSKAFVGAICLTIRRGFERDEGHGLVPANKNYTKVWLTLDIILLDASKSLLKLECWYWKSNLIHQ